MLASSVGVFLARSPALTLSDRRPHSTRLPAPRVAHVTHLALFGEGDAVACYFAGWWGRKREREWPSMGLAAARARSLLPATPKRAGEGHETHTPGARVSMSTPITVTERWRVRRVDGRTSEREANREAERSIGEFGGGGQAGSLGPHFSLFP